MAADSLSKIEWIETTSELVETNGAGGMSWLCFAPCGSTLTNTRG